MPQQVNFVSKGNKISANIFKPKDFNEDKQYASIILCHPASGCKQQTVSIYAKHLVEGGFIILTYDASYQGKSQGEPRQLQDPVARVQDIRAAVDYLTTLKFIDQQKIGVLGICAGGGYAVNASMTDRRIKAVGTITGKEIYKKCQSKQQNKGLSKLGWIKKENKLDSDVSRIDQKMGVTDRDYLGATEYYTTPRGKQQGSPNLLYFASRILLANWDAFHFVDKLLIQPLQIIVGQKNGAFGAYRDSFQLYDRAASKQKNIHVIKDAQHYDLYDQPKSVEEAVSVLIPFYQKYLKH